MKNFKRILVGLDLSELDKTLLEYTSMLCKAKEVDVIYFFHVARSLDLPEEITEKYPDLLAPIDEGIEKQIQDRLDQYFSAREEVEVKIIVKEGNAEDKILRWSEIKGVDLIVLGKKWSLKGSGVLPSKLIRIAHCSVLMVPESSKAEINSIMAPVDFSKTSALVLQEAFALAQVFEAEVVLQNTYHVPVGFHASGKTYEEFESIMKKHARADAAKFLSENSFAANNVKQVFTLDDNDEPADKIYAEAKAQHVDLVVIGSRGRTGLAAILLGSVADKICQHDARIPLLVIKNKKENMGFLDALLRI
ncbi:universal stress protein [Fulvivirga sp. M361]|uniref:universal stress protein n=1 Tax=Fulvivirga sp. M361 TaxID=2594266 RepID=UPI001179B69B|nr:universal stress protein [Fulvivirga sp. M361]TRX58802.1 universal stress protein [Fulvivirga sp. M361]